MSAYVEYREKRGSWALMPVPALTVWSWIQIERAKRAKDSGLDIIWDGQMRGTVKQGEWTIRLHVSDDDDPDRSMEGKFTDKWQKGALINPRYHRGNGHFFHYFLSGDTEELGAYYAKQGMARGPAAEAERAAAHANMKNALGLGDISYHCVSARAYFRGVELASASCGEIGVTNGPLDPYIIEMAHELMNEALAEGQEQLEKLRAPIAS